MAKKKIGSDIYCTTDFNDFGYFTKTLERKNKITVNTTNFQKSYFVMFCTPPIAVVDTFPSKPNLILT